MTPVANQTVNVGVTVNIANVATDPDVPPQTLTFSLLAGPGSVDAVQPASSLCASAGREARARRITFQWW